MIKKALQNHWFWFISVFTIYTIYDIIEHISRPDSVFEQHAFEWTLFSLLSQISLMLVLFGSIWLGKRIFKQSYLVVDILAITLGVVWHVYLAGPLINHTVFPYSILQFFFHPILPGILVGIYLVIRGVLFGVKRLLKRPLVENS